VLKDTTDTNRRQKKHKKKGEGDCENAVKPGRNNRDAEDISLNVKVVITNQGERRSNTVRQSEQQADLHIGTGSGAVLCKRRVVKDENL